MHPRSHRRAATGCGLVMALMGCSGVGSLTPLTCPAEHLASLFCPGNAVTPHDASTDGGGVFPSAWGEYAARWEVPACPAGAMLEVNTTDEGVDGAFSDPAQTGATLSFLQALRIAANRPGPDTIAFAKAIFPTQAPGVIRLSGDALFQFPLEDTCIDGRDRGVIIEWAKACANCVWSLGRSSLQVGLTLRSMPEPLKLKPQSQLVACSLDAPFPSVEVAGAILGPGNVLRGTLGCAVRADQSTVVGNFFGFDPTTQTRLPQQLGMQLFDHALVAGNVFYSSQEFHEGFQVLISKTTGSTTIRGNFFEGDVGHFAAGVAVFGPDNVVRTGKGVSIQNATVQITRNSISGSGMTWNPYVFEAPVAPPTVTFVSSTTIRGTCPTVGLVEAFFDPQNLGERFLGDSQCSPDAGWVVSASVPSSGFVTATLTDTLGRTSTFSMPLASP